MVYMPPVERTAEVGLDFVRDNAVVPESLGSRRGRSAGPRQRRVARRRRRRGRRRLTTSNFIAVTPPSPPAISASQPPVNGV